MHPALTQWKSSGRYFQYRGHSIFYKTEGAGTPLLLLHGFPTSSWDWSSLWAALNDKYQLIALDFIGFGLSDKPRHYAYSLQDQAELTEQLLKHVGISRYHILAHDIGDSVAQELLARKFDRKSNQILSCCFLNGGLFPETHRPTRAQKLLLGPFGFLISRLFSYRAFSKSFSIIFFQPPSEQELRCHYELITHHNGLRIAHKLIRYILERRVNRERWLAAIQHANCQLLLIDGVSDPVSGAHMVKRYRELVPLSSVVEIEGCGHYPQLEKPGLVLQAYLTFRGNLE